MLRSLETLEKGFKEAREKSIKECGEEIEYLRTLIFDIKPLGNIFLSIIQEPSKNFNSLVFWNWLNFVRNCGYTLYLTNNALYRNAYENIRHIFESIVQALYLDSRHPNATMEIKVHILSEVEDKHEYHVQSLIKKLEIEHKERIGEIYKNLSKMIHPTIKTVKSIFEDFLSKEEMPAPINCEEILNICAFMRDVVDVFLYLCISYFSEHKEKLKDSKQLAEYIKKYNLFLTSKALRIKTK